MASFDPRLNQSFLYGLSLKNHVGVMLLDSDGYRQCANLKFSLGCVFLAQKINLKLFKHFQLYQRNLISYQSAQSSRGLDSKS